MSDPAYADALIAEEMRQQRAAEQTTGTESHDPVWLQKVIRDLLDYPHRSETIINALLAVGREVPRDVPVGPVDE